MAGIRKKRYCKSCYGEIFNRSKSAIYCKECSDRIKQEAVKKYNKLWNENYPTYMRDWMRNKKKENDKH